MRLLVDTQIALWWQATDRRLEHGARQLVESADEVMVSRASLWEVAVKVSIGKLPINVRDFAEQVEPFGFIWLEISNTHLFRVAELPFFANHRDPFDRLLVAQALSEPLTFVTADQHLQPYGDFVVVV